MSKNFEHPQLLGKRAPPRGVNLEMGKNVPQKKRTQEKYVGKTLIGEKASPEKRVP